MAFKLVICTLISLLIGGEFVVVHALSELRPQNTAPPLSGCAIKTASIGVLPPGIPIGDGGIFLASSFISNANPYIWDVDIITFITHPYNSGLDITLRSPEGTVVTITTGNGGGNRNVFNGTRWDDQAGTPVTDFLFTDDVVATSLVPEEAMGAFIGENPNGSWTLEIVDKLDGQVGNFIRMIMILTLCPTSPAIKFVGSFTQTVPGVIPDNDTNGFISEIVMPAELDGPIRYLNVETEIVHPHNSDLNVTLISPTGTEITLTTNNGNSYSNIFNGTRWDDRAGTPVTDFIFVEGITAPQLVPEETLSALNSESANGTWKLKIVDTRPLNTGALNSWKLNIMTGPSPLKTFLPLVFKAS